MCPPLCRRGRNSQNQKANLLEDDRCRRSLGVDRCRPILDVCSCRAQNLPPYTTLDLEIQQRFLNLPVDPSVSQAEYVWIGGNHELRCKTRTLNPVPKSVADLPMWNFDGSSTEQARAAPLEPAQLRPPQRRWLRQAGSKRSPPATLSF